MNPDQIGTLVLAGGGLALVVWVLHKVGKALTSIMEALATLAVLLFGLWLALKAMWWAGRLLVTHWRTTLAVIAVAAWCSVLGWPSLLITGVSVALGLTVWWSEHRLTFEPLVGRRLRSWWLRWTVYARRLPTWLRACGLVVQTREPGVTVNLNPLRPTRLVRQSKPRPGQLPTVLGVRAGASWDEVRVRLVPGQKPEDFDDAARALASARGVARCQVRELTPNVVSLDFQRRNLLTQIVPCRNLVQLVGTAGADVDLRRVWSGRTEYGTDWHQPIGGSHTLVVAATGGGKNSFTWCPLVSIAPAIRDGLVRPWGIDPKGMELAYGRRIFGDRYAVTGRDALALLDELVAEADRRKAEFAGRTRMAPVSTEFPLELVEFDELGALTRYIGDRKLRDQILERIGLLTTQGRALGIAVRGYVQEPNKDIVPVRDLFPRRICLRVPTKSHVGMALGDQAWQRGAWADRIGESEPGVGYLFGEGIREPLRVRGGWVDDDTIKALETFVTGHIQPETTASVITLPSARTHRSGDGAA